MPDFLISLIAVVVILGFMILIHEFGHYAVAKWLGVRVEVFSIGFGKRLLGFRKGDTDYRISAIPLGGYVKMSGENPMDERTGDPAEFLSHSRWHRFLIAIAGPTMNIMLAIFLLTSVYMVHYEYPVFMDKPAVIDGVKANSAAAQADLQPGDRHHQDRRHYQSHMGAGTAPGDDQPQPAARGHHPARRQGSRENHCPEAGHLERKSAPPDGTPPSRSSWDKWKPTRPQPKSASRKMTRSSPWMASRWSRSRP